MPKKIRRKSSSRRITARPLSFWNFIRKNFLIIAGLLLLPVTVGAVLSSYGTFSDLSSAAAKKKPAVLKTQVVNSGLPICKVLQAALPGATGDVTTDLCSQGASYCELEGSPGPTERNGMLCECKQFPSSRADCRGPYVWFCKKDESACPILKVSGPESECREGDQEMIDTSYCGKAKDGSEAKCRVCQGGKWSSSLDLDCPDNGRAARLCNFSNEGPDPTQGPQQPTSPPPASGGSCSWYCAKDKGPDDSKCPGTSKVSLPKFDCDGPDPDGNGMLCADCINPQSAGGFNLQKALQNFFGIFGF